MKFKKIGLIAGTFALSFSLMGNVSAETNSGAREEIQIQASSIQFYKTLPGTSQNEKEKALIEHADAIELVSKQLRADGFDLEEDMDNIKYQQYVLSLGTAFGQFAEEDMKKVVEFVKFMDWYENYDLNRQLKEYQSRLKQNVQLSTEEIIELSNISPILVNTPSTADNEQSTSLNSTSETNASDITTKAVSANGYNNITARDYAYKWWDTRNPTYSTYYGDVWGCAPAAECWDDCTNFVSQALRAGGMNFQHGAHYTDNESWAFGPLVPTHTWGGAQKFYNHWSNRAGVASSVTALQTGDAVNADFGADGTINHTAIITRNTGDNSSNKYLTQHSIDRKEEISPGTPYTLQNWFSSGYKVYGYEIDKAPN
ncbi:amidase domain-containing protein [Paenibacillus sp. QZ-Y1]|uniref:amidase domain-containing protein n=1 Tax=Paenibacillus sp. QZ-Y1 TaxID=3414511 RepID=UPI003F7B0053